MTSIQQSTSISYIALSLALAALVLSGSASANTTAQQGCTLNWIVPPEPAAFIPLTTTAGGSTELGPKVVEGLLTYDFELKPLPQLAALFKEWVRGNYARLERNPNYWDKPKPCLDAIVVRVVPDAATRAAALESGEVQLANKAIALSDIERFQKLPNFDVDITAWPYVGEHPQMYFSFDSEPFKQRTVRQAVAQSLNLDAFAKTIWYGQGTLSASPIGKAESRFHNEAIKHYPFDTRAAEKLLNVDANPNVTIANNCVKDWGVTAEGTRTNLANLYFAKP